MWLQVRDAAAGCNRQPALHRCPGATAPRPGPPPPPPALSAPADLAVLDKQRQQRVPQAERRARRQLLVVSLDLQDAAQ